MPEVAAPAQKPAKPIQAVTPAPLPAPGPESPLPTPEPPRSPKKAMEEFFGEKPKPAEKAPVPPPEKKAEQPAIKLPEPEQQVTPVPEPAKLPPVEQKADPLDTDLESILGKQPEAKVQPRVEEGPKELRQAYEKLKAEHSGLSAKVKKLEALETVKEEFERVQKERDELSTKLEQANYLDSPTFKKEWEEPFVEKLDALYKEAGAMLVEDGTRVGSEADINELYSLWKDRTKALSRARELFGPDSTLIVQKLNDLKEFEQKRDKSITTWKETKKQRQLREAEEGQRRNQMMSETWVNSIREEKEANPELYTFDGDDELKTLAAKGEALSDAAFMGVPDLEPAKMIRLQAIVRNRAAAFGPMARKALKLEKRIKELEAHIKEYESGAPEVRGSNSMKSGGKKVGLDALEEYMKA